jgi:hypothetical protein
MEQKRYKLSNNFNEKIFVNSICQFIDNKYNAEKQVLGRANDCIIQIREKSVAKK